MPAYVRRYREGSTVFLTIVTFERRPLFADERNVDRLRHAVRAVCDLHPVQIEAAVVLPDHLHFLWTLPENDADYSTRVGKIKVAFTKSFLADGGDDGGRCPPYGSASRAKHRERDVWQRRFIEHTIRDEADFGRHAEYTHFNPVKHGLVRCPHEWPQSSFHKWVAAGLYRRDWYCTCDRPPAPPPTLPYNIE